jgi:hypothetical protein
MTRPTLRGAVRKYGLGIVIVAVLCGLIFWPFAFARAFVAGWRLGIVTNLRGNPHNS